MDKLFKSEKCKTLIISFAASLAVTVLCATPLLRSADLWLCDKLYQTPEALPGDIVIVCIDENDFMQLGPYKNWDRTIMASALEYLGSSVDKRPAVVAIDTLYAGTTNEEADNRLAAACFELDPVITASEANIGRKISYVDGHFVRDDYAILSYEEAYPALKNMTSTGHINAMYDNDGVLRHANLYIEPDGERVYSMAYTAARLYALSRGKEIEEPPVNGRGQFYVSYSAKPGGYYEGISITKLINKEVDPAYFAGKIVLIGPYAPGLQDSYVTPIERSKMMYGVEFQANVIQYLLNGNYKQELSGAGEFIQLVILFTVCFAFFIFCHNRKLRFSIPVLLLLELIAFAAAIMIYNGGLVIHALWIPLGLIIMFIVSVAGNYIRQAVARQNVTRTFERYVAPNIVGEILKEGTDNLKLGGKLCNIAVLFVDIRGFTTMSERLSPEEVVHILNQYLSMTSSCIEENKGTLDKFIGDATMAFWGAPIEDPDPVFHAVRAAMDIVEGAKKLSAKLKEEIGEELNVGVGVHYGPAVVGNMGSERRMDYTAIGDTVNTSARLEANAPAGTVYISRAVADELKDRITYQSLGDTIKLKGKADGFEVLKLTGLEDKDA